MQKQIPILKDELKKRQSIAVFTNEIDTENLNLLTHSQYAQNSLLSMTNDWNLFVLFCVDKQHPSLPTQERSLVLFLEQLSSIRKFSSIRRCLLTISLIHRLHDFPDPTSSAQVQLALSQLKINKKGDESQANPMTPQHLAQIDDKLCQKISTKSLRDLCIYYIMFECILKRSQLRQLSCEQIKANPSGLGLALYIDDMVYELSFRASELLSHWLVMIHEGYLFRRINRHGEIGLEPLNDSSIYRIFRQASDILELPYHLRFTGQSSRIGAAQSLAKQGVSLQEIQQLGRWQTPAMPAQYINKKALSETIKLLFKKK